MNYSDPVSHSTQASGSDFAAVFEGQRGFFKSPEVR